MIVVLGERRMHYPQLPKGYEFMPLDRIPPVTEEGKLNLVNSDALLPELNKFAEFPLAQSILNRTAHYREIMSGKSKFPARNNR